MRTRRRVIARELPRTFSDLNAWLPLRPIQDSVDLANAREVVDRLAVLDRRTTERGGPGDRCAVADARLLFGQNRRGHQRYSCR